MTDSHGRRSSAVEHFRNRSPGGNARRARALRPHPSSVRGSIEDGYQPSKLGVAGSSPAVFHYFRAGPRSRDVAQEQSMRLTSAGPQVRFLPSRRMFSPP